MTNLRQQKKQCRKAYRTVLKSGQDSEVIKQLSSQWFHLIRQHNETRLMTLRRSIKQKARNQQIRCDKDFWKFVASVFHDKSSSNLTNSFPTVHDTELHLTTTTSRQEMRPDTTRRLHPDNDYMLAIAGKFNLRFSGGVFLSKRLHIKLTNDSVLS